MGIKPYHPLQAMQGLFVKNRALSNLTIVPRVPRAVLISGASTGIGLYCAQALTQAGWLVFAGVRRMEDATRLQADMPTCTPICLDVTDPHSIAAAMAGITERLTQQGCDGLHALVNNAGIAVGGPLELLPAALWQQQWAVNVTGVLALTQAALPLLRSVSGCVVNMGSVAGMNAFPWMGAYSASKFALAALSDALRLELQPWNVSVVLIEAGSVTTPIWDKSRQAVDAWMADLPWSVRQSSVFQQYAVSLQALRRGTEEAQQRGIPPEQVAQQVVAILNTPRPQARYRIGRGMLGHRLLRLLPDALKDRMILRRLQKGLQG